MLHRSSRAAFVALSTGAAVAALTLVGTAQAQKGAAEQPVTYWMTADTTSGMAAMAANRGAMMRAAFGGGSAAPAYARTLQLQLGGRRATGEPTAEHLPPTSLGAGPSLPLVTPRTAPAEPTTMDWRNMERPKGRILIYWGCGERARPGQPAVIDFATMTSGKMPAAFAGANLRYLTPPSPGTAATYGEWPNQRSQASVPQSGSLVGAHVVRGNYTPEMRFTLGPANDFLAPVALTANQAGASGSIPLAWRPVANSKAWLAGTVGAAANGDLIMWSSSELQSMPISATHLANDEIARLVSQKVLMNASATSCTIPVEVAKAAPQSALTLTAFGGEANFAEGPLPRGVRPQWSVKLLTKSTHMGMLGMDMEAMMRGAADGDDEDEVEEAARPRSKKDALTKGIKGLLGF